MVIADELYDGLPGLDWPTFQARLGGPVRSWLPFETSFAAALANLGHNQAVEGVDGRPDELFEEYVQVALQFLLGSRVIRYGQDRRGEPRPDGVGLDKAVTFLYDAKAYADGYPVELASVRQFCSYIRWFEEKYGHYVGRVHCFLVVSGHFAGTEKSRQDKSDEMYAECGVRLAYMDSENLGRIVELLKEQVVSRQAVDWKRILSRTNVTASDVAKELTATRKDRVLRAQ